MERFPSGSKGAFPSQSNLPNKIANKVPPVVFGLLCAEVRVIIGDDPPSHAQRAGGRISMGGRQTLSGYV